MKLSVEQFDAQNQHAERLEQDVRFVVPGFLHPLLDELRAGHKSTYVHSLEAAWIIMKMCEDETFFSYDSQPLDDEQKTVLVTAFVLHDIGKLHPRIKTLVDLDEEYTDEQRAVVSAHAAIGANHIRDFAAPLALNDYQQRFIEAIAQIVENHHSPDHAPEGFIREGTRHGHNIDRLIAISDPNRVGYLEKRQGLLHVAEAYNTLIKEDKQKDRLKKFGHRVLDTKALGRYPSEACLVAVQVASLARSGRQSSDVAA